MWGRTHRRRAGGGAPLVPTKTRHRPRSSARSTRRGEKVHPTQRRNARNADAGAAKGLKAAGGGLPTIRDRHQRVSGCLPEGIAGPERPPAEGWDGVHIPTLPRGTPSVHGRGSLRSRPPFPARRSRPGGRGATAIRQEACAVADVHVRNACPRTRTPMSMCARRPAPVTGFPGRKPAFEQVQLAQGPSLREVSFAQVVRSITRGIE